MYHHRQICCIHIHPCPLQCFHVLVSSWHLLHLRSSTSVAIVLKPSHDSWSTDNKVRILLVISEGLNIGVIMITIRAIISFMSVVELVVLVLDTADGILFVKFKPG